MAQYTRHGRYDCGPGSEADDYHAYLDQGGSCQIQHGTAPSRSREHAKCASRFKLSQDGRSGATNADHGRAARRIRPGR